MVISPSGDIEVNYVCLIMFLKKKGKKQNWQVSDEYLSQITEVQAKFIFEHAEKQLKDTLDTNAIITSKSTTLITLTVGLVAALFGFSINRLDVRSTKIPVFDALMTSSVISCAYLFIVAILLTFIIHPKSYYILGSIPSDFFCTQFFNKKIPPDLVQKFFYINEIEQYYQRISKNKKTNRWRGILYKISLYLIVFSPIAFIIIYLIVAKWLA